jgi:hypothetical protein
MMLTHAGGFNRDASGLRRNQGNDFLQESGGPKEIASFSFSAGGATTVIGYCRYLGKLLGRQRSFDGGGDDGQLHAEE